MVRAVYRGQNGDWGYVIKDLNQTYGWDSVLKLTDGGTCEEVLGKSSKDIYAEWVSYLKNYRK